MDNQKNRWKRVCVYQEIRNKVKNKKSYLSEYWMEGKRKDINADNTSAALKFATTALNYPSLKGIPIDRVDTH